MLKCYSEMLPELHAEQQLSAIEAATAPQMTRESYRETVGRYSRILNSATPPARATAGDMAAMGITVEQGGEA